MRAGSRSTRLAAPFTAVLVLVLALPALSPAAFAAEPSPTLGRTFVVGKVSGTVFVKPRGGARIALSREPQTIPVGSTVNATRGKVRLVGAVRRSGGKQAGVFYAGAFKARQARRKRAVIDLQLVGGNFAGCGSPSGANAAGRQRLGRRLWGIARGNFRTRGRQAAATIRGTKWLTEDRCDSSAVTARRGEVVATNGTITFTLDSGDVFQASCTPPDVPTYDADNCIATLGDAQTFAFGLTTEVFQGNYTLCVQPPTGDPLCREFALPEPQPGTDYRLHAGACMPDRGPGTYTVSWAAEGQLIGTLPVQISDPQPPGQGLCPVTAEELGGG